MKQFHAGYYQDQGSYKSFQPNLINRKWHIDNMKIITLLSQADRQLGRLDMYSEYVPNINLFIRMYVVKEATQSSKIEGTQTKMEEALLSEENVPVESKDDWEEVQNYIKALEWSINELTMLPLSSRLIRGTHKILMEGVRGEHKHPGGFRKSQNWIGGASINDAAFVPPVHTSVNTLMGDMDLFINNENIHIPELLKIALFHYQFETIHPFLDGNGRVGRLLIPLYLINRGILKKPILYLSDYFENNRAQYYDKLILVRKNNDLDQWFDFFLNGLIDTAKKGILTFDKILQLQKHTEDKIYSLGSRADKALKLVNYLYTSPYTDAMKVGKITESSMPSTYKLISDLEKIGILHEITGAKRNRLFVFEDYLQLFLN